MLQMFGFERVAMVLSDLYFVDPAPEPGQEGAERGVRLELRRLVASEIEGSIYAARPITVSDPLWRIDLLESVDGPPGSFDRTHHHPRFEGWEPGGRRFVPELSAAPLDWLEARLRDLGPVLAAAGVGADDVSDADIEGIRDAAPAIVGATRWLLDQVHEGRLAAVPDEHATSARVSWL